MTEAHRGGGPGLPARLALMIRRVLADTRVRFLMVGGTNTVVGYTVFALLYFLVLHTADLGYLVSLFLSYVVSIPLAFFLYRRFVFLVTGSIVRDFIAFVGVNASSVALNALLLWLLVEVAHAQPLIGQALALIVTTIMSYVGHRFVSFRRRPDTEPPPPA